MKVRFAPSPTGMLHVGNARQAIANFLYARRYGGVFQLRIDDTDIGRSKEDHVLAIKKDLQWLGIEWQDYARQSERLNRYALAIERLKQIGRLYPCFETEQELAAKRERQIRQRRPPVYDRSMLKLTTEQRIKAEENGKIPYWRFMLTNGVQRWHDLVLGDCQVNLPSVSDPVLIRADGTVMYTLASVVDDLEMEVTHIIRGEDHVTNTGVQLDIAMALGAQKDRFVFAHLPLLLDIAGGKLSKRLGALSLRQLRQDGIEPAAIVNYLARLGTSDNMVLVSLDQLVEHYDISHVSRSAARFDPRQLLAMNGRYLHSLSFSDVRSRLPAEATEAFWLAIRNNIDMLSEAPFWWRVVNGVIVSPIQEEQQDYLCLAAKLLPSGVWDNSTWSEWINRLKKETGKKGRELYHPLRLALTGEEEGPELKDLLPQIGRERVLSRLL